MKKVLVIGTAKSGPSSIVKWTHSKDNSEDINYQEAEIIYGPSNVDHTKLFNPLTDHDVRVHHDRELITFLTQLKTCLVDTDVLEVYTKRITQGKHSSKYIIDGTGQKNKNTIATQPIDKTAISINANVVGNESNNFKVTIDDNRINPKFTFEYIPNGDSNYTDPVLTEPLILIATSPNVLEIKEKLSQSTWRKYLNFEAHVYDYATPIIDVGSNRFILPNSPDSYRIRPYGLECTYDLMISDYTHILNDGVSVESIEISEATYTKTFTLIEGQTHYRFSNVSVPFGDPKIVKIISDTFKPEDVDFSRFPSIYINDTYTHGDKLIIEIPITIKILTDLSTDTYGDPSNLYGLRLVSSGQHLSLTLKNNTPNDDRVEYRLKYFIRTEDVNIFNLGTPHKGYITSINQRDTLYNSLKIDKGLVGIIFERYNKTEYDRMMDLLSKEKPIPKTIDAIIVEALNYSLHKNEYISYLPELVPPIQLTTYNHIEVIMQRLDMLYPLYFNYSNEVNSLIPQIILDGYLTKDLTKVAIIYSCDPQLPKPGIYSISDGQDTSEYSDAEYLDVLYDEFLNPEKTLLSEYVEIYGITDVVLLGAYIDSSSSKYATMVYNQRLEVTKLFTDPDTGDKYITVNPQDYIQGTDVVVKSIIGTNGIVLSSVRNNNQIVLSTDDGVDVEKRFPIFVDVKYTSYRKEYTDFATFSTLCLDDMKFITSHYGFYPFIKEIEENPTEAYKNYIMDLLITPMTASFQNSNSVWATISSLSIDNVEYQDYNLKEYIHPFILNHITNIAAIEVKQTYRLLENVTEIISQRTELIIDGQNPTDSQLDLTDVKQKFHKLGIMWFYSPQEDNQSLMFCDNTDHVEGSNILKLGTYSFIAKTLQYEIDEIVLSPYRGVIVELNDVLDSIQTYVLTRYPQFILNCTAVEIKEQYNTKTQTSAIKVDIVFKVPFSIMDWAKELTLFSSL